MGIWQWMLWRRRESAVAEVAARVVSLVSESVRPLVERRVAQMGLHEARGYVRARAGHLIDEAIAMVTAHDLPYRRQSLEEVRAASIEQLVRVLLKRPKLSTIRRAA
jgi:hypothetical protein